MDLLCSKILVDILHLYYEKSISHLPFQGVTLDSS